MNSLDRIGGTTLIKLSQTLEDKYWVFSLICLIHIFKKRNQDMKINRRRLFGKNNVSRKRRWAKKKSNGGNEYN